ncbi:transposase family protein [Francisella halioticida]|uniref:transposase family protein n=1 Tax=Francisella halioticida TaxID=549298 RepID=UPI0012F7FCC8
MTIIEALKAIEDPRQQGKINYSLIKYLFISICAIFNSAGTWENITMSNTP